MKIKISNGRIVNPSDQIDRVGDIYIDNQLIISTEEAPEDFTTDQEIDASGKLVIPGLVDIQCRVREPGNTHKATIATETRAASLNGITSLCIPPDSAPVTDNAAVVELIHHRNQKSNNRCHIYTIGAITKGLKGDELANMGTLKNVGCVAVSNALQPFNNNLVQRRAMEYASGQGILIVIQPYDHALYSNGCAHEGALATRMGLPPIPEAAETAALARDIELVAQTGARTHFGQLSCARSVGMIRQAKKDNLPISADVSMHQLFLTENDILGFDTRKLTIPPLRSEQDRSALLEGLADGTIDCICSDHQPHDADAKLKPFPSADPGISTLDVLLPLLFRLIDEGVLDIQNAVSKLTSNPARIFGIPAGHLAAGELADITIVNPDIHFRSQASDFVSAGKNNAFEGWDFSCRAEQTLVAGRIIE